MNRYPMNFFSSAVFWGVIVILVGLSIILKAVFGIHIPFVRIIFGFIFIYWGVRMITGGAFGFSRGNSAIFNQAHMNYDESQRDYDIIFGNGTVDLFKMEANQTNKRIEVNVVFGNGTVILNDSIPTLVEMNSVFGAATSPDKTVNAIGKTTFTTSAYKANEPYVFIKASVVFGKLDVQTRKW